MTVFSPGMVSDIIVGGNRGNVVGQVLVSRAAGRAARVARRRGKELRNLAVKGATMKRYHKMLDFYKEWCRVNSFSYAFTDQKCADFLQFLFENGASKNSGADFLCGVQHVQPALRRCLPTAWRWFGAWQRFEPPNRAPPCPRLVLAALVATYCRLGHHDLAAAFSLTFHTYLRPAELLALTPADVKFYQSVAGRGSDAAVPLGGFRGASQKCVAVLALDGTKPGGRRGVLEYVEVFDPVVLWLLRGWVSRRAAADRLLGCDYARLRKVFSDMVEHLGGRDLHLRLYSLRRGGASFDFRAHGRSDSALHRGRWGSLAAAQVYLKDAQASAVRMQLDFNMIIKCRRELALFREYLRQEGVVGSHESELFK